MASGNQRFRRYGMPFGRQPKPHVAATARACRAVVADAADRARAGVAVFRALQFTQFTTPLPLDADAALRHALERVPGVDAERSWRMLDTDDVPHAYEADRAEARTAEGGADRVPGQDREHRRRRALHRAVARLRARRPRAWRPAASSRSRPTTCCIANLDPSLERREPPETPPSCSTRSRTG